MGKAFQFSGGFSCPTAQQSCEEGRAGNFEEERVMNFKCLTWDLHGCLKRDLFINGKSS